VKGPFTATLVFPGPFKIKCDPVIVQSQTVEYDKTVAQKLKQIGSGKFVPVDIRRYCTMGFTDEQEGDGKGGYDDEGPTNDMHEFPVGKREFRGVTFDIIDPKTNGGKSCITLGSKAHLKDMATQVQGIDLGNRKFAQVYFLHTMAWTDQDGKHGEYRIHYRGEEKPLVVPLINGQNIIDWWNPRDVPEAFMAWYGYSGQAWIGVYVFPWKNPYPDKPVASVDFISDDRGPVLGLMAITGEE
jgi:hypothetical protein